MLPGDNPKRMEIYMTDMPHIGGSIQCGYRPAIIVQNNAGNESSSTVIVVPLTSRQKHWMPTHVNIGMDTGIRKNSIALCEQIQTIPKAMLVRKIGEITTPAYIEKIRRAIEVSLALSE